MNCIHSVSGSMGFLVDLRKWIRRTSNIRQTIAILREPKLIDHLEWSTHDSIWYAICLGNIAGG